MKPFGSLIRLCRSYSRTGGILMSTDAPKTRPDVRKLLDGTTSFDSEAKNERFVSSAYNVDKTTLKRMEQDAHNTDRVNPRDTTVILFPGQGSQYLGMTKRLTRVPGVNEMFEYASSMMKIDLLKLCEQGPEIQLNMTINCQTAVLVTSLAVLEKLKIENPVAVESCVTTAGFSVGEYAALVFAGVLTFEEAVQVVKLRSEAMQSCANERQSGLLIVFTGPGANINYAMKLAREWCSQKEGIENPVCEVSNYLSPDCKVIGGDSKALGFLARNARDLGIKRSKRLPVSGAFHTRLMKPAANVLKKVLAQVELKLPTIQVVSNVTAHPYQNTNAIRKALVEHVVEPVKWEQTMHQIYSRDPAAPFPTTYEVGPGSTLRPLLKSLNQKAYSLSHKVEV